MTKENKTVELTDEELNLVTGGKDDRVDTGTYEKPDDNNGQTEPDFGSPFITSF